MSQTLIDHIILFLSKNSLIFLIYSYSPKITTNFEKYNHIRPFHFESKISWTSSSSHHYHSIAIKVSLFILFSWRFSYLDHYAAYIENYSKHLQVIFFPLIYYRISLLSFLFPCFSAIFLFQNMYICVYIYIFQLVASLDIARMRAMCELEKILF